MKKILIISLFVLTGCAEAGQGVALPTLNTIQTTTVKTEKIIPFTSQAPYKVWDDLHNEACEEASVVMVNSWYKDVKSLSVKEAEKQILSLVEWEKKTFGYFEDTTMEQVGKMLVEYYKIPKDKVMVVKKTDLKTVIEYLNNGAVVIMPTAGRLLKNPYFKQPGPLYHNLVLISYDAKKKEFVVNDSGTKRGKNYRYKYDVLDKAWHDWNKEDILKGEKNVVVVRK
ncbi:MAG: C39 family peptidase [bacterium]